MNTPILRMTRKIGKELWLRIIAPSGIKASLNIGPLTQGSDASSMHVGAIHEVAEPEDTPPSTPSPAHLSAVASTHSDDDDRDHDGVLVMCLDICTPATLAAMHIDHLRYIRAHGIDDTYGCFAIIQEDADDILSHLASTHFGGDQAAALAYIQKIEPQHMPF